MQTPSSSLTLLEARSWDFVFRYRYRGWLRVPMGDLRPRLLSFSLPAGRAAPVLRLPQRHSDKSLYHITWAMLEWSNHRLILWTYPLSSELQLQSTSRERILIGEGSETSKAEESDKGREKPGGKRREKLSGQLCLSLLYFCNCDWKMRLGNGIMCLGPRGFIWVLAAGTVNVNARSREILVIGKSTWKNKIIKIFFATCTINFSFTCKVVTSCCSTNYR